MHYLFSLLVRWEHLQIIKRFRLDFLMNIYFIVLTLLRGYLDQWSIIHITVFYSLVNLGTNEKNNYVPSTTLLYGQDYRHSRIEFLGAIKTPSNHFPTPIYFSIILPIWCIFHHLLLIGYLWAFRSEHLVL